MSTLLWLLTEAGLVLCWLVTPWAPAPWLALCWLMAPLAGWLALLLTRKRSQVRLTCPVTAEKGKPFSVTAEVRQGVPFGRGRLTVSVENTVTGETHREKLTLHLGRGGRVPLHPGGYAGNTGKMDVELGAFGEKTDCFIPI